MNRPRRPKTPNGAARRWIEAHRSYEGDECLPWPYATYSNGYGHCPGHSGGRVASRAMCFEAHGPPPSPEHEASHKCGNGHKACTNPRHLRWATPKENNADKLLHGTWNGGKRNGQARLTEEQVEQIRKLVGTMSDRRIGDMFGVTRVTILRIRRNIAWRTSSSNIRALGKVG